VALVAALLLACAPALAQAKSLRQVPGYVDGSALLELAGEDNLRLEVSISGTLLKTLTTWDPELHELTAGLHSIHAVVIDVEDPEVAARAKKAMRRTQSELQSRGWERVALVREEDSEIHVHVLSDEKAIQGLVVMIVDSSEDEPAIIFANVAGTVDLAAIQRIGEGFGVPGLSDLKLEEDE
jgi:hypothetical protein